MDRIVVRRDSYFDSVFLMSLSAELGRTASLEAGHVVLATPANRQLLEGLGFELGPFGPLGPTDLVVALRATAAETIATAETRLEELIASRRPTSSGDGSPVEPLGGVAGALQQLPGANLALISVPGEYAAYEAAKALEASLHVMIFSDNVSIDDEVALKRRAADRGLLVMGPDCGTAMIGGKPLCFANRVRSGPIGLIGASGTGLQEVSCQIHRLGSGVSQMIGVGGRDLSTAVGGLSTLAAIDLLAADAATRVLVVVSKPPAPEVAARVIERLTALGRPSVVVFLGDKPRVDHGTVNVAEGLSEAAWIACSLVMDRPGAAPTGSEAAAPDVAKICARMSPAQRWLQGLFCGGTLAAEALLLLRHQVEVVRSNLDHDEQGIPSAGEHAILDLGDDVFTRGRPHPMIEPRLRAEWIAERGGDPTTAVLLLDCVLGHGSHPDPAGVTAEAIAVARARNPGLAVMASVTGTDLDLQGLTRQQAILREAGAAVLSSNAGAAAAAARVIKSIKNTERR